MRRSYSCLIAAWLMFTGGVSSLTAGSYTVKPVRIELSQRAPFTTITVANVADRPATIQAHVAVWTANGTEEVLSNTSDVLMNPPIFTVQPGQSQSMRLGLRRPAQGSDELSYRLIFEEVPVEPVAELNGIRTLLRISVPIFVRAQSPNLQLVWSANRTSPHTVAVSVFNPGNTHVQVKSLALGVAGRQEPGVGKSANVYVLPSGRKEWTIEDDRLPEGQPWQLNVQTDSGELRETVGGTSR